MYVALDTNILIQNQSKKTQNMRILNDYVKKTESKILIHEIVEAEALGHIKEEISKDFNQIEAAFNKAKKYNLDSLSNLNLLKIKNKNIKQKSKNFLDNLYNENTLRVKMDGRALREVIRRSIERKRPSSKNGEELRDTIIWLNLLKYCNELNHDFAFISNNTNDFASDDKTSLHNDLLDDIKRYKINVQYFTTLEDFLTEHAEPIANITFDWVRKRIDMDYVKSFIINYLLHNNVASHFKPCKSSDRNLLVPVSNPELPSWSSPSIEFEDFFVWRFKDQHLELSLIFYAYVEIEFDCMLVDDSTLFYDSYIGLHHVDYCTRFYSNDNDSYYSHSVEYSRVCYADLRFRISAKIEDGIISLEEVEDLYNA